MGSIYPHQKFKKRNCYLSSILKEQPVHRILVDTTNKAVFLKFLFSLSRYLHKFKTGFSAQEKKSYPQYQRL